MKLTKKRERWAESRKDATLVGKPLSYPAPAAAMYEKHMQALIKRMRREYERETLRLFRDLGQTATDSSISSQSRILLNKLSKKWESIFTQAATDIVNGFINRVDNFAQKDTEASLKQLSGGLAIKTPKMPDGLRDKLIAATNENVSLIKSIPAQYYNRIEGAVMRSIMSGQSGAADIYDELMKIGGMSERRAKLIATDQTRKITSAANVERMKSAGVKKWRWLHSRGGAEPRQLHLRLNGQEFSYDDEPPIIDERTGERGYPGQLINCRCVQQPIISFDEADD